MKPEQLDLLLKARQSLSAAKLLLMLNAVTADQADEQITRGEQFLALAENLIGTLPPP